MIVNLNPRHLDAIKTAALAVAGIKSITPKDCRVLSFSIMERVHYSISETTIKRLFGFAFSKFNPSYFTLNALAVYCGYESWEAFCQAQPNDKITDSRQIDAFNDPLFKALVTQTATPTVILTADAPHFTIITYNEAYENATLTKNRNVRGLTIWEAFHPEKAGGYGPTLLLEAFHQVIYTQKPVHMQPLHYNIPSALPDVDALNWWDIKIVPVCYDGVVEYLLLHTYNITDKIVHQDAIEDAIMRELTLAEDLATTNVKLNLALNNLADSHAELVNTKHQLEELNKNLELHVFERSKKLFESEGKQRKLIDSAPVAIAVLRGPDHVVETANKKIIEYWGKDSSVVGEPLATALPELEGQPFIEILDDVRKSGVPYVNAELRAYLNYYGTFQPRYFDMIYQPIQLETGITESIFIVAVDITEHVIARKKLEQSESMLRLAVTAANIGIWLFIPLEKTLTYNTMFAKILGWDRPETMTYEQALNQVTDEYREKIVDVIETAIADGGEYNFTYAQKRFNDGEIIWLRAIGKIMTDELGNYVFSGIIREIQDDAII